MISSIVSRLVILVFGTLYPAYASYKAVRAKNVKEYVKWMMYWIVFALFTCAETFTDVFLSFWFPFYYEIKVILVLWLLSPATKGSSILYRKFVHPMLTKREQEIDEYIARAKEQGYHTVLSLGSKGVNYATSVLMQTAIKGGGGLVNQLRRSYSLSDISSDIDMISDMNRSSKQHPDDQKDHTDAPIDARLVRTRGYNTRSSPSGGVVDMYFPEMDVDVRQRKPRSREPSIPLSQIRSNEDVSSGYSSGEPLYSGHPKTEEVQEPLIRTSSVGATRVTRTKTTRTTVPGTKRTQPTEDSASSDDSEDTNFQDPEGEFFDVSTTTEPVSVPFHETTSLPISSQSIGQTYPSIQLQNITEQLPSMQSVFLPKDQPSNKIKKSITDEPITPLTATIELEKNTTDVCSIIPSTITSSKHNPISPIVGKSCTNSNEAPIYMSRSSEETMPNPELSIDEYDDADEGIDVLPIRMPFSIQPSYSKVKDGFGVVNTAISKTSDTNIQEILEAHKMTEILHDTMAQQSKTEPYSPPGVIVDNLLEAFVDPVILIKNEVEFFDAENDKFENTSNFTCDGTISTTTPDESIYNIDIVTNAPKTEVSTENDQVFDSGKVDRAGKYNKRPAPCPPNKLEVDIQKLDGNGALNEATENSVFYKQQLSDSRTEIEILKQDELDVETVSVIPMMEVEKNIASSIEPTNSSSGAIKKQVDVLKGKNILEPNIPPCPIKPRESEYKNTDVSPPVSPHPPEKKVKSKHDSPISRLLSMPKNQLQSLFPFLNHNSSRGLVATSLTSLSGDLEEQLAEAMHGSLSCIPTASGNSSGNAMLPPKLPPRKKSQGENEGDVSNKFKNLSRNEATEGNIQFRMREMSHSPPRRQTNL